MFDYKANGFEIYKPHVGRGISDLDWVGMTPTKDGWTGLQIKLSPKTFAEVDRMLGHSDRMAVAMDKTGRIAIWPMRSGYAVWRSKTRVTIRPDGMGDDYRKVMGLGARRIYVEPSLAEDGSALILTPNGEKEE